MTAHSIRRAFTALVGLALALLFVPRAQGQSTAEDEKTLRHFKLVLWPAAYRTQDVKLLDSLLHDSFVMIGADGRKSTKREEMEFIAANTWDPGPFEYRIERLEVFQGSFAVVAGTGVTPTYTYTSSNYFVKEGGRWRAVGSHVSGYRKLEPE